MNDAGKSLQQFDCDASSKTGQISSPYSGKQQQLSENIGAQFNVPKDIVPLGACKEAKTTLRISNPEVAKIIKDTQHAMMSNNPVTKPFMVTLNISVQNVPSQIMESFGEQEGDSGQQLMSTGNTQQVEKGMVSISQANNTNKMNVTREQQAVTSEVSCNRKTWADEVEEGEEYGFDNTQDDSIEVFVPSRQR